MLKLGGVCSGQKLSSPHNFGTALATDLFSFIIDSKFDAD